jgi:hypothetical protein
VYIRRHGTGEPFDGEVRLTVMEDRLIGTDPVVYGPASARLEEAIYKFHPRFESEANYLARIEFEADGAPWMIDLPIVVGEPGSPWAVVGGGAVGLLVFLVIVRAIRIKMQRRVHLAPGRSAGRAAGSLAPASRGAPGRSHELGG